MWLRKSRKEPVLSHISMKNLPESERPYERFQILGAEALSDAELLAIILRIIRLWILRVIFCRSVREIF